MSFQPWKIFAGSRGCQRLRPPPRPPGGVTRERPIDGLRGICALLVLSAHLFLPTRALDPRYAPSEIFGWFDLGTAAVLMFFVLSGYVIGITVTQPAEPAVIKSYALRRLLRLAPITWAAVFVSWIFMPNLDGRTIAGHLLFLNNAFPYPGIGKFPLLANNPNLWSLHYEAVYYVVFIAVWRLAPNPVTLFAIIASLALGSTAGLPVPRLVTRYACGALFWFGGLCTAWLTAPAGAGTSKGNWPAAMLTAYAIWVFAPLRMQLLHFGILDNVWPSVVLPHRLDFLPVCLWIIMTMAGRGLRACHWLGVLCICIACSGLLEAILTGQWSAIHTLATVSLTLALTLFHYECPTGLLATLAPVGGVSFAVYVLAGPIQLGQRAFLPDLSGSPATFALRVLLVALVLFTLAWLLERRLQPWLVARLSGPKKSVTPRNDTI